MRTSRSRLVIAATAVVVGGALVGCGEQGSETPGPSQAQTQDDGLVAEHGLEGMSAGEIIEQLDRADPSEKPNDLIASVRPDELVLQDPSEPGQEQSLPIEEGFYLSVAPYIDGTHDCFHHSLTTCQGELVGEDLEVTVTDSEGEVLVDDTVTTYPNGFAGFWLPRDIEGTLEVAFEGRSAQTDIATGPDDPTCLTTVKLT